MLLRCLTLGFVICLVPELTAQQMPTPSDEHKIVMRDVGEWNIEGKMMMEEGMQDFKAEEKVLAVGEFWTVSHYSSDMFG